MSDGLTANEGTFRSIPYCIVENIVGQYYKYTVDTLTPSDVIC